MLLRLVVTSANGVAGAPKLVVMKPAPPVDPANDPNMEWTAPGGKPQAELRIYVSNQDYYNTFVVGTAHDVDVSEEADQPAQAERPAQTAEEADKAEARTKAEQAKAEQPAGTQRTATPTTPTSGATSGSGTASGATGGASAPSSGPAGTTPST